MSTESTLSWIRHRDLPHLKQTKHHAEEGGEGPTLHENPGWRLGMDGCVSFLPGKNLLSPLLLPERRLPEKGSEQTTITYEILDI